MFTKTDHILGHKESLRKCHNAKINNKILKVFLARNLNNNNFLLNYYWIKADI